MIKVKGGIMIKWLNENKYLIILCILIGIFGLMIIKNILQCNKDIEVAKIAYANPAKWKKLKQYIYTTKKTEEKEDIKAKGNAKKETKPDGTEIISGDELDIKKIKKTDEKNEKKTDESENTKPLFQSSAKTSGLGIVINPFDFKEFGLSGETIIFESFQLQALLLQQNLFQNIKVLGIVTYLF